MVFSKPALAITLAVWWLGQQPAAAAEVEQAARATVDFDRQIRHILADHCYACHGPDEQQRKAKLRLDVKEGALAASVIVPGHADRSELIQRVASENPRKRMPPEKTGKRLTAQQIDLLRRWIDEGAHWSKHWAFVKPVRPSLPQVRNTGWVRNPIDRFIAARLEREGLEPSPPADKTTLIRRVTLDLTGLPPTLAEIDAFLADESGDAYEKLVDRLLNSPRYGERLALEWLDAARFADTHGYHIDSGRDMGRWREWVINAFNHNMPFDRFTIEQMAGDLLPQATLEQRIASGFHRNHMINFEGGAIPEEYHNAYIVDRVNTTATVWMGLTLGCAQCHDHKFDPITQKEYYQLYAFFHNVPEKGLDGTKGNAAPVLKTPSLEQQQTLDRLMVSIRAVEAKLHQNTPELTAAQGEWEKSVARDWPVHWTVLDPMEFSSKGGTTLTMLENHAILATGVNPAVETYTIVARTEVKGITAIRLEALPDERFIAKGPGRSSNGNYVLTDVALTASPEQAADQAKAIKIKAAAADFSQQDYPVAQTISPRPKNGWAIYPEVGKAHTAIFETDQPIHSEGSLVLTVTLDFQSPFPQHQIGKFRLSVTHAREPRRLDKLPANIREILGIEPPKRLPAQETELRTYYRTNVSSEYRQWQDRLGKLRQDLANLDKQLPTTMVMEEMPSPRDTFLLLRGQYDKRGDKVSAGTPSHLPPLPGGAPHNRLGLARWLVDPAQPLTARVIVNRFWQMYFGTGIVKTAEDFGTQGEWPSHPELLDWLAAEFQDSGWNVKAMQRLIVTSAAYRQASVVRPEHLARDPENRLLARMPRLRLPAEFIRDQALAISGLLDDRIGGKSVSPYQPPGLWEELASRLDGANWTAQVYQQSHGPDLYRRTMYTFWKRTSPPPTLVTFDAPDRETCTVRRARTNTPLQALVLMNDPTYVEACRKLAERLLTGQASPEERITMAFRLATARPPKAEEIAVLRKVLVRQLAVYGQDRTAALKLLEVGESPRDAKLDPAELAAWTMVASVILNLDETVTRG